MKKAIQQCRHPNYAILFIINVGCQWQIKLKPKARLERTWYMKIGLEIATSCSPR